MTTFPNLFIIGAMKAGTSSLHEYLHQHPQIFMSRFKEPQYFAPHATRWGQMWGQGNPYPEPGIDWYLRLFEDAGDVRYAGESSVSYSARPWVEDCEKRIHAFNPDARIIYLMRDPIERAISHYWFFVKDGREDRDLVTAIRRRAEYIARSHYAMQLEPYIKAFGREKIFAFTLEEFNADPDSMFRRLFTWLEVDHQVAIDTTQRFNVSDSQIKQTRRGYVFLDTMLKHYRWKRIEPHLPGLLPACLKRFTYRPVQKSQADLAAAIDLLRPLLRSHTDQLRKLLDRDFPEWTTLYPSTNTSSELVFAVTVPSDSTRN